MDPFAHTLTAATLAATGLRRVSPLATAALLIGANAPDIDVVMMYAGDYMSLAHRRGWTHGVLALVILPFLLTGLLLLWDHYVRRRRNPGAEAVQTMPLLAMAAIGVISHPLLDWLNNYGMRWLMPFDGRWSYGDALFIIDPWVWLVLGGVCFLVWSRSRMALVAWALWWLASSWLVMTSSLVPDLMRGLWLAGLALLLAIRLAAGTKPRWQQFSEPAAITALSVTGLYMLVCVLANFPARSEVRSNLEARGIGPVASIMVSPVAANPFKAFVIAETAGRYYSGSWNWLAHPRFEFDEVSVVRNMDDPLVAAAAEAIVAQRFLTWARFPYAEVVSSAEGHVVRFADARYLEVRGPGSGPTVTLDRNATLLRH